MILLTVFASYCIVGLLLHTLCMHAYVNSCLHWGMDYKETLLMLCVLLYINFMHLLLCHSLCQTTHTHAVPPSPPLNVRVVDMSSTTLTLAWEEPVSTGGRGRDELQYNLWFSVAGETSITLSSTVTTTMGVIGGKQLLYKPCTQLVNNSVYKIIIIMQA